MVHEDEAENQSRMFSNPSEHSRLVSERTHEIKLKTGMRPRSKGSFTTMYSSQLDDSIKVEAGKKQS